MKLKPDNGHEFMAILLLLLLGLFAIGLQHSFVGMYYDDFGNASLSYGYVVEGVEGTDYTIGQLLTWAKYCYLNWGGRVLYAVLFVIPLLKNGVRLYMFIQSFLLIGICFVVTEIIVHYTNKKYRLGILLLLYIFYGLISRDIHAHATYWASASVLYVWPLLPLFSAIWLYLKTCQKIKNNQIVSYQSLLPLLILLLFFAACSQEQVGISVIVFLVFYIGFGHRKEWKKYRLLDGTALISAVISYLLLFLAPGNFVRLNQSGEFSELSFLGKLQYNLPRVLNLLFMDDFRIFNILLLVGTFLMVIYLFKQNRKWGSVIGSTIFLALVYTGMFTKVINLPPFFRSCFYLLFLVHFLVVSIAYFYSTERPELNAFTFAAGSSVFCLLYSPGIFQRSTIEYLYFVFILLAILFIDSWEQYCFYTLFQVAATVFMVFLGVASLLNFSSILKGYYKNDFYNRFNHERLATYQESDGDIIFLTKLPYPYHKGEMPYEEGKEFIHEWYRQYYNIPSHVSIQWSSLDAKKNLSIAGDFYDDGWFGSSGLITISSSDLRKLYFNCYVPEGALDEPGLIIRIDGSETIIDLQSGVQDFSFGFGEVIGDVVEIEIQAKSTYIPVETGLSDDKRELSMILRIGQ